LLAASRETLPKLARCVRRTARSWVVGQMVSRSKPVNRHVQEATDEVQPRYGEIRIPALILWGEEDRWIDVA
jgi:pimeloyl-ACP methyl ester carboxylesterase